MSSSSNDHGRAYEYAWLNALYNELSKIRQVQITKNSSFDANQRAWFTIDKESQERFELSAKSAVDTILELEPLMSENSADDLLLELQKDSSGIKGDVRDIVIKRENISWEVGLSIKHNHDAVKHSRLSHQLDFGNEWFGKPCCENYWAAVTPIFEKLKNEKKKRTKWSDLPQKESSVYIPLLNAFIAEINHAYSLDSDLPKKMVEYLIGTNDYYKVISQDSKRLTMIHTFNIHNTLNKPSTNKISLITVPLVDLPTEIIALKFKTGSKNTIEMYLNNGWQLSFRIHNASTYVEPSLKFDIQFIGMPVSILSIECKWR